MCVIIIPILEMSQVRPCVVLRVEQLLRRGGQEEPKASDFRALFLTSMQQCLHEGLQA